MNKNSTKQELFTSKANVLKFLSTRLRNSKIEQIFDFTINDWGKILPAWQEEFSDRFVEVEGNIVFTGRGGYEYDLEENDETKKAELHTPEQTPLYCRKATSERLR